MKPRKTRKNNRRRNMYGGQVNPPPYSSSARQSDVLIKLQRFDQDALILKNYANDYKSITTSLNNTETMRNHLQAALNIADKGEDIYGRAQALWQSIYGSAWVPPAPAPAPR